MWFDVVAKEYEARRSKALAMGGEAKLAARRAAGVLNARERVALLLDPDSFVEEGLFAVSSRPGLEERTPADGKIAGFGRIAGRPVAVVANDFTVMGASSTRVNGKKIRHVKMQANSRGIPLIFLGESSGARMPDIMGASGIGSQDDPVQYQRLRESPWVSAVLGHCYGSSAWYTALSDYAVMRKGAIMAVSSPRLTAMATSESVDESELGGWEVHTSISGIVDLVVDTDEEALGAIRRFLSYMPSSCLDLPPTTTCEEDATTDAKRAEKILDLLPQRRTQAYDMRRLLQLVVDDGSLLELKPRFGKSIVTGLARLRGQPIGIVANNPMFKGGAIDSDACSKATSFLALCDSFNIPLIFFVDQPGFLIGKDGERKGMIGRVMNWMNALSLCTVPKICIVVRKTYGQAVLNMGMGGNADIVCAWSTAEISFMDPRYATQIVYGVTQAEAPEEFEAHLAEMEKTTSAYDAAGTFSVHTVIDPRDTRAYLQSMLRVLCPSSVERIGSHRMNAWPTTIY